MSQRKVWIGLAVLAVAACAWAGYEYLGLGVSTEELLTRSRRALRDRQFDEADRLARVVLRREADSVPALLTAESRVLSEPAPSAALVSTLRARNLPSSSSANCTSLTLSRA